MIHRARKMLAERDRARIRMLETKAHCMSRWRWEWRCPLAVAHCSAALSILEPVRRHAREQLLLLRPCQHASDPLWQSLARCDRIQAQTSPYPRVSLGPPGWTKEKSCLYPHDRVSYDAIVSCYLTSCIHARVVHHCKNHTRVTALSNTEISIALNGYCLDAMRQYSIVIAN